MTSTLTRRWGDRLNRVARLAVAIAVLDCGFWASAQDQPDASGAADAADRRLAEAMEGPASPAVPATASPPNADMNLLELASPSSQGGGGPFMVPIYFFSFVVVLFGFERAFALRRRRIIPPEFATALGNLSSSPAGFDPRKAYKICQQFPSTAANVVRAVLLKTGRPHAELEEAVTRINEREAEHLYRNIRPLNLSATAAPLLGLLGTVQGMIMTFFVTAHLPDGANKAQQLAQGVYVALVTTFAGLCVAIPAVCLAHFYEGKIQRLFRETDDLVYNLMPQLERFEGKLKVSRQQLTAGGDGAEAPLADKPREPARAAEV